MSETTGRALALLNLLQTHRHWSGPELAERLAVTARTLRRDVERLRDLGYRIESVPGAAGGYRLEAGSAVPPLLLTDEEAIAMAVGLRLAATQALTDGASTTLTALAKLEQVLPSAMRQRVNALASTVDPITPERPAVSPDLLGQLALVCRDHERVRFHYRSASGEESDRLVEPYSLVPADRHWFLLSWDVRREDWRTFRVDRLSDLFLTRVRFAPRPLPDGDAAEFVRVAVASARRGSVEAAVVMDLPFDEMRAYFGPWARDAAPAGRTRTRWPVAGHRAVDILGALTWIPDDVTYRIEAPDAVVDELDAAVRRMSDAVAASRSGPRSRNAAR